MNRFNQSRVVTYLGCFSFFTFLPMLRWNHSVAFMGASLSLPTRRENPSCQPLLPFSIKSTIPSSVGIVFKRGEIWPQGVLRTLQAEATFCQRKQGFGAWQTGLHATHSPWGFRTSQSILSAPQFSHLRIGENSPFAHIIIIIIATLQEECLAWCLAQGGPQ